VSVLSRFRRLLGRKDAEEYRYPLERENHRIFPPEYSGFVYVWDIDKTYLESDFNSLKGMLKIPFELAVDKRTIAGADSLLRLLRRSGPDATASGLYFVSASPNQLRKTIAKKMLLDGVEHDGITLKDWSAIIKSGRMGKLREQIGYKLSALLLGRRDLGWRAREILFGDDSESDALSYSLYADICAGRLRGDALRHTVEKNGVGPQDARYIESLSRDLPSTDWVDRIYIHIESGAPPSEFADWGTRLIACRNTFQMTLGLVRDGHLANRAIGTQAQALMGNHGVGINSFMEDLDDFLERKELRPDEVSHIKSYLLEVDGTPQPSLSAPEFEFQPSPDGGAGHGFVTPKRFLA
jgi:hypothetical protein